MASMYGTFCMPLPAQVAGCTSESFSRSAVTGVSDGMAVGDGGRGSGRNGGGGFRGIFAGGKIAVGIRPEGV